MSQCGKTCHYRLTSNSVGELKTTQQRFWKVNSAEIWVSGFQLCRNPTFDNLLSQFDLFLDEFKTKCNWEMVM